MNACIDSLWPTEIKQGILSPRDILETQAMALREQTGGLLTGEVRENQDKAEGAVYLILEIAAPKLKGVRHRVLTARHFADRIYPCHIDADGLRSAEVAHSDEEFAGLLRQVLHSGEVKALAISLIARVRRERKAEAPVLDRGHNGHRRLFRPAWIGVETDAEELANAHDALYDERAAGD